MQKARVFVVDDQPDIRDFVKGVLAQAGHKVVLQAGSRAEAVGVIRSGRLAELKVDVAVVDGRLETKYNKFPVDGVMICEEIHSTGLPIKTIAYTSSLRKNAPFGDLYACKSDGAEGLLKAFAEI